MLRLYFENALARAWQYGHCFICSWVWGTHQAWGISSPLGWFTGTSKARCPKPYSFPPKQAQSLSYIPILMPGTVIHQDTQKGNLTVISNVSLSLTANSTSSPRVTVSCISFLLNCCNLSTWVTLSLDSCDSVLSTVLAAVTLYPPKHSSSITSSRWTSWTQQSDFGAFYGFIFQGPLLLCCECWQSISPPPPPEFL